MNMLFVFVIGLGVAYAALCGRLCSKCHPRYIMKPGPGVNSTVDGVPDKYMLNSLFYKFKRVDAASFTQICETVKLLGINEYIYKEYSSVINRTLKVPVGYVLSFINFAAVVFSFDLSPLFIGIWLAVFLASHFFFFARSNKFVETLDMQYPLYSITSETSAAEDIEKLEHVLNTTGPAAKYRVEIGRSIAEDLTQSQTVYLIFTAVCVCAFLAL